MSTPEDDPELVAIRRRMMAQLQEGARTAAASSGNDVGAAERPGAPVDVTDATFDRFVAEHDLVLVDLWAPWCGPCRMVGPIVAELAAERRGRLAVAKVDVDHNPAIAGRFQVQAIPTLLLFRGGRLVDRVTGALPKPRLEAWVDRHAA